MSSPSMVKIRKMDGTWKEVEGEAVHIKGFKGYTFLLHESHSGWRASEASTGAMIVKGCTSKKEVLETLRSVLQSYGKDGLAASIRNLEEKIPSGLLADTVVEPLPKTELAALKSAMAAPIPYAETLHGLLTKGLLHREEDTVEITATGKMWLKWELGEVE